MFFTELVLHLRKELSSFKRRVGSTSAWGLLQAQEFSDQLPVPYCFVLPAPAEAEVPQTSSNNDYQKVKERILTIVVTDNSTTEMQINLDDKDAQKKFYNYDQILFYRQEIFNALAGWTPVSPISVQKMRFIGSTPLEISEARIYHQVEWEVEYYMCVQNPIDPEELLKKICYAYVPVGEDGSVLPEDYIDVLTPAEIANGGN